MKKKYLFIVLGVTVLALAAIGFFAFKNKPINKTLDLINDNFSKVTGDGIELQEGTFDLHEESAKTFGTNTLSGFVSKNNSNTINALLPYRYNDPSLYGRGKFKVFSQAQGTKNVVGQVKNNQIIYPNIYSGVDSVSFITSEDKLKENMIFKDASAPGELRWKITTENLKIDVKENTVILTSADGTEIIRSIPPVIYQKNGEKINDRTKYTLEGDILSIKIDSKGLEYPFLLDPGWETPPYDLYFWSTLDMGTFRVDENSLQVGTRIANQWPGSAMGIAFYIATDGRYIYYATNYPNSWNLSLAKIDSQTGNVVVERKNVDSHGGSMGLAFVGNSLYLATSGDKRIYRVDTGNLNLTAITASGALNSINWPGHMISDGTYLYLAALQGFSTTAIYKINPSNGTFTTNTNFSNGGPAGITYRNGKVLVWLNADWKVYELNTSTLARGAAVTGTVLANNAFPTFMTTDGNYLYFGWYGSGLVTSLAKLDLEIAPGPSQIIAQDSNIRSGGIAGLISPVFPYLGPFTLSSPSAVCVGAASAVNLTWTASSGAISYDIERRTGAGAYSVIANVPSGTLNYQDNTVTSGTQYTYRIYANGPGGLTQRISDNIRTITAADCDRLLTVRSTNPSSGVTIQITSPVDSGVTQFTRTYNVGSTVTLVAPATASGNNFTSWTGCNSTSGTTCNVTMNSDKTVTANYTVVATRTLTVASSNPNSGVSISITAPSADSGNTQFTRTYPDGTNVILIAPATASGNNFSSWSGCNSTSGTTCNVTMDANKTVTATYSSALVPSCTLTATSPIPTGSSTTLNWTTTNATSGSINPGGINISPVNAGSATDTPSGSQTYTLSVSGPGGTSSCTANVVVGSSAFDSRKVRVIIRWDDQNQNNKLEFSTYLKDLE